VTPAPSRLGRRGALAAAVWIAWAGAAAACEDFSKATSTRWQAVRLEGRAWLVTPCGERVFSLGVNVMHPGTIDPSLARTPESHDPVDPRMRAWIAEATARVRAWGFNAAGGWSLTPDLLRMPVVVNLELGRNSRFHWLDPFHPNMAWFMARKARQLVAPYRNSPYRIGYFSDNEVGWWGGALFSYFAREPALNYTKQHWVAMLRAHYAGDWRRFIGDFVPPAGVRSWRDLLRAREITQLRPGGNGIAAVRRWTYVIAELYYRMVRDSLRAADPDALFLGDRLPIYYDPVAVRAEARYVDVISTNYNADSPEGWIAPYYFAGLDRLSRGKPVLVSEWFYAARENRTGNRNNGHLMTVATQAERASGAAAATLNYAGIKDLLGLHWFQYYDDPNGGRADGEDYDFGLVDVTGEPYQELVTALADANRQLPEIHAMAVPAAASAARPFPVPRATIDPAHASLIDWPKPASLLPPLKPSPGEIAFGEAYLSWSPRGLALGTIGQDYYDIGLLAYDGDFPLQEAFRLELHVDAGAGPRHFAYYFIPPRTKVKDHPPMAPKLCLGTPAEHAATDCAAVPGAEALYFGADQPRIAAEALIPWSALGLSKPPADGKLKVEISSTAWHRSRWMSLSGMSPAEGAKHPERWMQMRLN
jgi:hypothetical protein